MDAAQLTVSHLNILQLYSEEMRPQKRSRFSRWCSSDRHSAFLPDQGVLHDSEFLFALLHLGVDVLHLRLPVLLLLLPPFLRATDDGLELRGGCQKGNERDKIGIIAKLVKKDFRRVIRNAVPSKPSLRKPPSPLEVTFRRLHKGGVMGTYHDIRDRPS